MNYEHCEEADRVLPPLKEAGYCGCWSVESHKSTNEYNNVASPAGPGAPRAGSSELRRLLEESSSLCFAGYLIEKE